MNSLEPAHSVLMIPRLAGIAGFMFLLVLFAVLAGCGGDNDEAVDVPPTATAQTTLADQSGSTVTSAGEAEPTPGGRATATPDPEAEVARKVVEGFDPEEEASFEALNDMLFDDNGEITQVDVVPAIAPLLSDPDDERRWAALYITALLTDTPEEVEILRPLLADSNFAFRVIAAGSLAGEGVNEALPVLIEGLSSDLSVPYSDPPRPVADLAREALEAFSGQTFVEPGEWQSWWDKVGDRLRWDGAQYVAD